LNPIETGVFAIETEKRTKKLALGRGLGALIPGADTFSAEDNVADKTYRMIEIDSIRPNPYQPRRNFKEEELTELSRSIQEQGLLQPLVVRPAQTGYELIAGERRLRASRMAGFTHVPALVKPVSDASLLEMSLVENIQRENLNPVEESDAYHRLITEFGLTQEAVAGRVGKSRSTVANFVRIRNLPPEIRESLSEGSLSMGHAKALMGTDHAARQLEIWRKILARGLSVRETEALVAQAINPPPAEPPQPPTSEDVYFSDLAQRLSRRFGTRVEIRRHGKRGRLEIEFYSNEDLDRVLEILKWDEAEA